MNKIQNSHFCTPTPFNKAMVGGVYLVVITVIVLSVIGLATPKCPIVHLSAITNSTFLGGSVFLLGLNIAWMVSLCKKKKASSEEVPGSQPRLVSQLQPEPNPVVDVQPSETITPQPQAVKPQVFECLTSELTHEIFSHCDEKTLANCRLVSKTWQKFVRQYAHPAVFGLNSWKSLGYTGGRHLLPQELLQALEEPCPFWNDKLKEDTHIAVLIPDTFKAPLTLNAFKKLMPKRSWYAFFPDSMAHVELPLTKFGDVAFDKSHWIIMPKQLPLQTVRKTYDEMLAVLPDNYFAPTLAEIIVSMLIYFLSTDVYLLPHNKNLKKAQDILEGEYAYCQEMVKTTAVFVTLNHNVSVGNFENEHGIWFKPYQAKLSEHVGMLPVQRFPVSGAAKRALEQFNQKV